MSGYILFGVGLRSTKIFFLNSKSKIHELALFLVRLVRLGNEGPKFLSSQNGSYWVSKYPCFCVDFKNINMTLYKNAPKKIFQKNRVFKNCYNFSRRKPVILEYHYSDAFCH
jgi:hypothetical protein